MRYIHGIAHAEEERGQRLGQGQIILDKQDSHA